MKFDLASVLSESTLPKLPELELVARDTVLGSCRSPIPGLSPLLGNVLEQYHKTGLVGEDRNAAQVFLSCETRHLPPTYRWHVILHGGSGSGKTTLVIIVLAPFWGDVENYTRITGPGLERRVMSLEGKILYLEQLDGSQPVQLRDLMSGGKLRILVAGRVVEGVGLPVIVSTQVEAMNDPQIENRALTLEIDESEAQTARIVHHKLEQCTTAHGEDEAKHALEQLQRIDDQCRQLGPSVRGIMIPFALQLEKVLPVVLAVRRSTDQFTSLLGAAAFVKAAAGLRPLVKLRPQVGRYIYVVALPEDLSDALYCLGDGFVDSLTHFLSQARKIHGVLLKSGGGSNGEVAKEVAKAFKLGENRTREYLNYLVEVGYATRTGPKGAYRYEAEPHDTHPQTKLQVTFSESDLKHWFDQQFPNNAVLEFPEGAKSGFEFQPPVDVGKGFESDLGTIERTELDSGSVGRVVPDMGSGGSNNGRVPDAAK
jgi:hypothetical protein